MANIKEPQRNQGSTSASPRDNASIREHMTVVGSCGNRVGVVDHVEGNAIKLTRNDTPDGQHHFIPVDWVENVDNEVHLKKNSQDAKQQWKANAADCGC